MSESLFVQIQNIVTNALMQQDANTYHGETGDMIKLAHDTTSAITQAVDADEKDRKQREMMNPVRGGIVITTNPPPDPSRMDLRGLLPGARSV
jgi:hypothetical protein